MFNREASKDVECPNCHEKFSFTVGQILDGVVIPCPHCNLKLDTSEAKDKLAEVEKTIKDFKKNIES